MIFGTHVLLYSSDADADRLFLRDVLGFDGVDVGGGWIILSLPPAEIAVHPGDESLATQHGEERMIGAHIYLLCDDIEAELTSLRAKGVHCGEPRSAEWGIATSFRLPSGGTVGLYQPLHPLALKRN